MLNLIKQWIRAVVREETAKSINAEGLTIRVPVDTQAAKTLRGLKPGQTFDLKKADGGVDRVTVKGPKAPGKGKSAGKAKANFRSSSTGKRTIEAMRNQDNAFRQRYEQASSLGIMDSEILLYEQTGGYKSHAKNGLRIYQSVDPDGRKSRYSVRLRNFTHRTVSGQISISRISFGTLQDAINSADYRIPLYHEICAEQARKMKGRKA